MSYLKLSRMCPLMVGIYSLFVGGFLSERLSQALSQSHVIMLQRVQTSTWLQLTRLLETVHNTNWSVCGFVMRDYKLQYSFLEDNPFELLLWEAPQSFVSCQQMVGFSFNQYLTQSLQTSFPCMYLVCISLQKHIVIWCFDPSLL